MIRAKLKRGQALITCWCPIRSSCVEPDTSEKPGIADTALSAWGLGASRLSANLAARRLLAGVTVAAYLVPQVMAYAEVAGLPPIAGLWAAVGPLVAYAFLGSSRQLSVGPSRAPR